MKRFHLAAVMMVAALIGLSCFSAPAYGQQCEVKLGVVAPMSGGAAQWGIAMRSAAEMVAAEYAEKGGLPVGAKKCKITVIALDGKYTPEGAASAANNLVSQGVKFIIGPIGSPEVTGIKPVAHRNGMLVMCNSFAKDAIGPQWPLVFHLGPGPSAWADPIIKVAKQKFNLKRVVLVATNDQGGTDIASVDAVAYKKNGIEAIEEYYQRGTTNFAPLVTRVMSAKPDAIDTTSSPPAEAGIMVKQLRQAGFNGPIGRLGGPGDAEILRVAGGPEVVKNFYWYIPIFIDSKVKAMADEYKRLMKAEPPENTFFYQYVPATRMVTKAIVKAGTADDPKKVAEALRTLPVEDPNLGKGLWIGKDFFKINQELSFPFGIGLIVNGKPQPSIQVAAATGE